MATDLKDIHERWKADCEAWDPIRDEGDTDMLCVAGHIWEALDPKGLEQRQKDVRPAIDFDELSQYVNQLVNEVRANKRGIEATAIGLGANEQSAQFRQNLIRQIEYRSNVNRGGAYTVMFENAAQRGFGFLRVKSAYVSDESDEQELLIDSFEHPNLVTPDAYSVKRDGADMQHCTIHEVYRLSEFKRRFPRAGLKDFDSSLIVELPAWFKPGGGVVVVEHWAIETVGARTRLRWQDAQGETVQAYEDELPEAQRPRDNFRSRRLAQTAVKSYIANGVEIIEEADWPGKWIPIVQCVGKVLYVKDAGATTRHLQSQVRQARGPVMMYCYYRTTQAELAGMTPRIPVIGYEGQFAGHEREWQEAAHKPKAYVEARATTDDSGSQLLPLPQRFPYDAAPVERLEIAAEGARRAIQAAMGSTPLPTQAQRRNEKSGKALERIESATQKGEFHFIDHFEMALVRTGQILDDLIPHFYDTVRKVTVRKADNTVETVRINDPEDANAIDVRTGLHDITLSTGPSYDSEREAASDFVDTMVTAVPELLKVTGDLLVKLKNLGPIGDQLAERFHAMLPPEIRQLEDKQQGGANPNDPQAMQQELMAAKQQMAQMQAQLAQAQQIIGLEQAKGQTQIEVTKIKAQADRELQLELQAMKNAAQIRCAEIAAEAKGLTAFEQHAADHEAQAGAEAHESLENELDRQHEAQMAQQQTEAALMQGDQQHAQAMEQGDQAHRQDMEAGSVEHSRNLEAGAVTHAQALEQGQAGHRQAMEQGAQGIDGQLKVVKAKPTPTPGGTSGTQR